MSDPVCPSCSSEGIEHIVSRPSEEKARQGSAWFYVAHCNQCGHVYGVFTKHVFTRGGPQLIVESRK